MLAHFIPDEIKFLCWMNCIIKTAKNCDNYSKYFLGATSHQLCSSVTKILSTQWHHLNFCMFNLLLRTACFVHSFNRNMQQSNFPFCSWYFSTWWWSNEWSKHVRGSIKLHFEDFKCCDCVNWTEGDNHLFWRIFKYN